MIQLWHGGRRWDAPPVVQPAVRGRYECGSGIYLTNQYARARKYASGGGVTMLVELKEDISWLEHKRISLQLMREYVSQTRGFRRREAVLNDLAESSARLGSDLIPASYLVNLCVNHEVLSGGQGTQLASWLALQGIDASLHTVDAHEQWVVVFNPAAITRHRVVRAADVGLEQYTLPKIQLSKAVAA